MRNVLLAVFITATCFLAFAVYAQATNKMVLSVGGVQVVSAEESYDREGLNAVLEAAARGE